MLPFQIRYLLFSSLLLLASCTNAYRHMQAAQGNAACLLAFRPVFTRALYRTQVDVEGRHLGGLLLVKAMPDSSTRLVFSNEMGFSYFDLAFAADGGFKVYSIVPQMNKKAVLTTLRKDFSLLLMRSLNPNSCFVRKQQGRYYYGFPQEKGNNYYITDSACSRLIGLERASRRKPVVKAIMQNYTNGTPDSISISHTGFNFTISLKKLEP